MLRTIVARFSDFVCGKLEPWRPADAECVCRRGLKTRRDVLVWEVEMEEKNRELKLLLAAAEMNPWAIELGITPAELVIGCGCDRPRRSILQCGHCGCRSACDGCEADPIWRPSNERERESWCGCAEPGKEVLPCGHCGCGNGLCWEWVNMGPSQRFEKKRKASCV